jgi:hypothetical protein
VGHLITELGAVRDTIRDQSESPFLRDTLGQVTFEEHRDPRGIMAWIWGRKIGSIMEETAGPEITRILAETHSQYGIPGAVQAYGSGRWLFRWDDQG